MYVWLCCWHLITISKCNETMTITQINLVKFCRWIQNVSGGASGELTVKRYVTNSIATDCRMFRPCRALSTTHKILKKVAEGLALLCLVLIN